MSPDVVVGILADMFGDFDPATHGWLHRREMAAVTAETLKPYMAALSPKLALTVENRLQPDLHERMPLSLAFKSPEDFEADSLVENIEALRKLRLSRDALAALHDGGALLSFFDFIWEHAGASYTLGGVGERGRYVNATWSARLLADAVNMFDVESAVEWEMLLDEVMTSHRFSMDDLAQICRSFLLDYLKADFFRKQATWKEIIDHIDFMVGNQIKAIESDDSFRRLRATWKFVDRFLASIPRGASIEVRLLSCTIKELQRAFGFFDEAIEGDWDTYTRHHNLHRRALRKVVASVWSIPGIGGHPQAARHQGGTRNILIALRSRDSGFRSRSLQTASEMALALNAPLIVADPDSKTPWWFDWQGAMRAWPSAQSFSAGQA